MATPRTGSSFFIQHLATEINGINLGEVARELIVLNCNNPLPLRLYNTEEDVKRIVRTQNTVAKLLAYGPAYKDLELWLLDNATEIYLLERKDKRNQILSLYTAELTKNYTPLRGPEKEIIVDNIDKIKQAITDIEHGKQYLLELLGNKPYKHIYTEDLPEHEYPNIAYSKRIYKCDAHIDAYLNAYIDAFVDA